MNHVIIIGGGIAGLISAIAMQSEGIQCVVLEKRDYPAHKVCGEYISNEAGPYLEKLNVLPTGLDLPQLTRFQLSSGNGKSTFLKLDLGGFGVSRYCFDDLLYKKALSVGVRVITNIAVEDIAFHDEIFTVQTDKETFHSEVVLGAFGKRSSIDKALRRPFIEKRSPYIGVKYHIKLDYPSDLIALHNFEGGYCGVSKVENNIVNVCYLCHRDKLRETKNIETLEEKVLAKNPLLRDIFRSATRIFERPLTINEINFETKSSIENHVLMIGDAAGMITPLCGNGMAMAIHSAKIASEVVAGYLRFGKNRGEMERQYRERWNKNFRTRLWIGRNVQRLFGSDYGSSATVKMAVHLPPLAALIVRNTHGKPF